MVFSYESSSTTTRTDTRGSSSSYSPGTYGGYGNSSFSSNSDSYSTGNHWEKNRSRTNEILALRVEQRDNKGNISSYLDVYIEKKEIKGVLKEGDDIKIIALKDNTGHLFPCRFLNKTSGAVTPIINFINIPTFVIQLVNIDPDVIAYKEHIRLLRQRELEIQRELERQIELERQKKIEAEPVKPFPWKIIIFSSIVLMGLGFKIFWLDNPVLRLQVTNKCRGCNLRDVNFF